MDKYNFSELTSDIINFAKVIENSNKIDSELYTINDVKQGLRDKSGKGVLTGLTNISEVYATKMIDGVRVPCSGELYYRGVNVNEIIEGCKTHDHWGFEETVYLLLMGKLPSQKGYEWLCTLLDDYRKLPGTFVRDIIMSSPSVNVMNSLSRSVLTLYSYDENPEDVSLPNVLRQSLELIALFPVLAVYAYQAHCYYHNDTPLMIRSPKSGLSTAENILQMLRPNGEFTDLEAKVLDVGLVLHAEHGGGNNSSFTTRVVTSSGTDTYSAISAGLSSLKGFKHGGANIKVVEMFRDMKEHVKDWTDDEEITAYLTNILDKKAFDNSGLIYGIGHAVYSVSDPRAEVFKKYIEKLSVQKHMEKEYTLYSKVAKIAPNLIAGRCRMYKGVSANIDFYSGFVYQMLGLPEDLYTPIFAISRIAGWSAHRLEELGSSNKIIRPAYKSVSPRVPYTNFEDR